MAGVVEVDGIDLAGVEGLGEVDEDGAGVALVFELSGAEEDFVDLEGSEIELDAGAILEHAEADGVFAAEGFVVGIDADAEVVVEEIVVGAEGSIGSAEHGGAVGESGDGVGVAGARGCGLCCGRGRGGGAGRLGRRLRGLRGGCALGLGGEGGEDEGGQAGQCEVAGVGAEGDADHGEHRIRSRIRRRRVVLCGRFRYRGEAAGGRRSIFPKWLRGDEPAVLRNAARSELGCDSGRRGSLLLAVG